MDAVYLEALGRVAAYSPITVILAVLGWRLLNILERSVVRVCVVLEVVAEAYANRQRLREDVRESGVQEKQRRPRTRPPA